MWDARNCWTVTGRTVASEQNKRRGRNERHVREKSEVRASVTGLRVVRPTQAVRVEMRGEQPARVYLRGMRGEVVAASGPWRSSGDWWQEDAWHQDEWDLEIEFSASSPLGAQHRRAPSRQNPNSLDARQFPAGLQRGLYRIYFDALRQEWFLRGVYD
jgi:hypothetical protein